MPEPCRTSDEVPMRRSKVAYPHIFAGRHYGRRYRRGLLSLWLSYPHYGYHYTAYPCYGYSSRP